MYGCLDEGTDGGRGTHEGLPSSRLSGVWAEGPGSLPSSRWHQDVLRRYRISLHSSLRVSYSNIILVSIILFQTLLILCFTSFLHLEKIHLAIFDFQKLLACSISESQVAERWGNQAVNLKVASLIPGRVKLCCVLGQGTSPYLPRGNGPVHKSKSLWIRASAKWLNVNISV